MGIFDFLKKKPQEQTLEELVADLRAQRFAERQPILSRGAIPNAPAGFDHFNLQDVMIGKVQEHGWYLFAGDNAATLVYDIRQINNYAIEANNLVPGLPTFFIDPIEIVLDPLPDNNYPQWYFSRIIIEDLTPTGKLKKYPVCAYVETITGNKNAKIYYTLNGIIGKGRIIHHINRNANNYTSYGMDFINDVVSHVWQNTENGKIVLYNKNHDDL